LNRCVLSTIPGQIRVAEAATFSKQIQGFPACLSRVLEKEIHSINRLSITAFKTTASKAFLLQVDVRSTPADVQITNAGKTYNSQQEAQRIRH
jgi:hypothetical protein